MSQREFALRSSPLAFFGYQRHQQTFLFFFFNDTATTEIYTLSLHDALPICLCGRSGGLDGHTGDGRRHGRELLVDVAGRSEEHTSELQSRPHLVCRLLLEKKKTPIRPEPAR